MFFNPLIAFMKRAGTLGKVGEYIEYWIMPLQMSVTPDGTVLFFSRLQNDFAIVTLAFVLPV